MNDPTPDPHDELIREALRAEADGVVASDALRQRVESATTATRSRRAGWLVAVAAAAALVVGVGIVASQGDDEQEVDAVDDPATTTTTAVTDDLTSAVASLFECIDGTVQLLVLTAPGTSEADQAAIGAALSPAGVPATLTDRSPAEVLEQLEAEGLAPDGLTVDDVPTAWVATYTDPAAELEVRAAVSDLTGVTATSSTDCREGQIAAAEQPAVIVAVTADGRLVVLDAASGAELRELAAYDDPNAVDPEAPEGGPYSISGVALHPNGRDVYFETCCEPASGAVLRVPIDGSAQPEPVTNAYGIDISANGRWLVGTTGAGILLYDLEGRSPAALLGNDDPALTGAERVAVNADGSEIAVVTVERSTEGAVLSSSFYRHRILDGRLGEQVSTGETDGLFFPLYTADPDSRGRAMGRGVDLAVDASGTYLIEVDGPDQLACPECDGGPGAILLRVEGDGPRVIAPGPFVAADW